MAEFKKIGSASENLTRNRIEQLKDLFPEGRTENKRGGGALIA